MNNVKVYKTFTVWKMFSTTGIKFINFGLALVSMGDILCVLFEWVRFWNIVKLLINLLKSRELHLKNYLEDIVYVYVRVWILFCPTFHV